MTTLYHYCPSTSFTSIISARAIWLSSLILSNDLMEGKVLSKAFSRKMDKDSVDVRTRNELERSLRKFEEDFDGLGFCLSEVGDLLSQWRGYADDGRGYSIGFAKEYLEELSSIPGANDHRFMIRKVIYDQLEQENAILTTYNGIREDILSGEIRFAHPPTLLTSTDYEKESKEYIEAYKDSMHLLWIRVLRALPDMFALKSEAFSEEKEYRLVSLLMKDTEDDCLFRSRNDRLIPYRQYELKKLTSESISEVIIGPKNVTPEIFVEMFLRQNGFNNVKISRSAATYR